MTLELLAALPSVVVAAHTEVLGFVARHRLYGRGLSLVDAHLLASVLLSLGVRIWSRDKRLLKASEGLGLAYTSGSRRTKRSGRACDRGRASPSMTLPITSTTTTGRPDSELIIKTSEEMRLSNFLTWQSARVEFYFCDVYGPGFQEIDFLRALRAFGLRRRRHRSDAPA